MFDLKDFIFCASKDLYLYFELEKGGKKVKFYLKRKNKGGGKNYGEWVEKVRVG